MIVLAGVPKLPLGPTSRLGDVVALAGLHHSVLPCINLLLVLIVKAHCVFHDAAAL